MAILAVVGVIVDRAWAGRLIAELVQLYQAGLLTEWEEDFAVDISVWSRKRCLTVEQAAKLLEILQDRRKRTQVGGISIVKMVEFLDRNRGDLDEDDCDYIDEFLRSGRDYEQRRGVDRISAIARRLGEDFPRVEWTNFHLSRDEQAQVVRIARDDLKAECRKRRALQSHKLPCPPSSEQRGYGNDMSRLMASLNELMEVVTSKAR